jgi:hypothetical protein
MIELLYRPKEDNMKNMNEMLEQFVLIIAERMGKKYDVTAQLTWTDTFGPTVRKVENICDPNGGAYYVSTGTLHEDTSGHRAVFTISLPKDDVEDYITEWFKIEIKRLNWDPDGFRHGDPLYWLPEPAAMDRHDFEAMIEMMKAGSEIAKDFEEILWETKFLEHQKALAELGR